MNGSINQKPTKILAEFEGRKVIDGKKRKYWIQILTEEYIEEATNYMCGGFLKDEPLCRYTSKLSGFYFKLRNCLISTDLSECEESLKEIRRLYPIFMQQRLAMLCFTNGPDGKPQIAGLNVTFKAKKDDPKYTVRLSIVDQG